MADLRTPQLPLGITLRDAARFETFLAGPNAAAVDYCRALAEGSGSPGWIWGGAGSGRSHLLQAACARAEAHGGRAVYLPLLTVRDHGPGILEGFDAFALVCLDDVDGVAGKPEWERALFNLYNALQDTGGRLLMSAASAPAGAGFGLRDLASRAGASVVFQLRPLSDDDLAAALQLRADHRGLELPDETARLLLRRLPRDMASLGDWLDHLDTASLAAQRRLTVRFVTSVLNSAGR